MVARGAKGNPWIFNQIRSYLETGVVPEKPEKEELKAMIMRHGQMLSEFKGEHVAMREMRKHVGWYLKGVHGVLRRGHGPLVCEDARRIDAADIRQLCQAHVHDIVFPQIDASYACCGTAHGANFIGVESRADAVLCDHQNIFARLDKTDLNKRVALVDVYGADSAAVDIFEIV